MRLTVLLIIILAFSTAVIADNAVTGDLDEGENKDYTVDSESFNVKIEDVKHDYAIIEIDGDDERVFEFEFKEFDDVGVYVSEIDDDNVEFILLSSCGDGVCEDEETRTNCRSDCDYSLLPFICIEGWKCRGNKTKAFLRPDCSWKVDEICSKGCVINSSDGVQCAENETYCGNDICENLYELENCEADCDDLCGNKKCDFDSLRDERFMCPKDCLPDFVLQSVRHVEVGNLTNVTVKVGNRGELDGVTRVRVTINDEVQEKPIKNMLIKPDESKEFNFVFILNRSGEIIAEVDFENTVAELSEDNNRLTRMIAGEEAECFVDGDCDDFNESTSERCEENKCYHSTRCLDNDRRCPDNCNFDTDNDCIPEGKCKSHAECDDNEDSTVDYCVGTPKRCKYEKITACISEDGYCPEDCIYPQDRDCDIEVEDEDVVKDKNVFARFWDWVKGLFGR